MNPKRDEIILKACKLKQRAYDPKSSDREKEKARNSFNDLVQAHGITRKEILRMDSLQESPSFSCFGQNFKSIAEFKMWMGKLPFFKMVWKSFLLITHIEKIKKTVDVKKV